MGMYDPIVKINGEEIRLDEREMRLEKMAPHVALPMAKAGAVLDIEVRVDCSTNQHDGNSPATGNGKNGSGFWGMPALLEARAAHGVSEATYRDGKVTVRSGEETWTVEHEMMEG